MALNVSSLGMDLIDTGRALKEEDTSKLKSSVGKCITYLSLLIYDNMNI